MQCRASQGSRWLRGLYHDGVEVAFHHGLLALACPGLKGADRGRQQALRRILVEAAYVDKTSVHYGAGSLYPAQRKALEPTFHLAHQYFPAAAAAACVLSSGPSRRGITGSVLVRRGPRG